MAGIPVHKAAAINASTAQPTDTTNRSGPAYYPATTTMTSPSYPVARPGAIPGPAPTGAAQPTSYHPTPTAPLATTQTSNAPPSPQPGAVPSPLVAPASPMIRARRPSIPPPPKAGEIPMPAAYYARQYEQEQQPPQSTYSPQIRTPPPQAYAVLSTPTRAIPPASTTSTPGYNDLSHPPGYMQNSRASFDERPDMPYQNENQNHGNSSGRGGLLGNAGPADRTEQSPIAQIWNTAMSWAQTAGEKLKEGEEEVWRRINEK